MELLLPDGTPTGYRFQNFATGRTLTRDGFPWIFAGFGYSGGSFDATGSSIQANLLMGVNDLSLNVFGQASGERWLARITTAWLSGDPLDWDEDWATDLFEVLGPGHDGGAQASIRLGSSLDAVEASLPRLRLTQAMVGNLPPTGTIPLS